MVWQALLFGLALMQETAPTGTPQSGPKSDKLCTLAGQVVNAATGEPLKKAELTLMPADPAPGSMPPTYGTTTDAAGKYAMKDLKAGRYRLLARRNGFVYSEYGSRGPGRSGTALTLEGGQEMKDVDVRLTPQGVIAGRVLDDDGEPVAYARVQVMRYRYTAGKKQLMPAGAGSTNDLGEYRVFSLPPGRYYVNAVNQGTGYMMTVDRSARPTPEEGYVPVWYPGTTDRAGATTLDVQAGGQMRAVDFTLSKVRTVRVRGRVVNETGRTGRIFVQLSVRDSFFYGDSNRAFADAQGNFTLSGVAPGAYTLTAYVDDQDGNYGARQSLDVGSEDLDNVTVTIAPGMNLTGQVKVEGPGTVSLSALILNLVLRGEAMMIYGGPGRVRINDNGAFTVTNVSPALYELAAFNLPDGYYLKSVRMGDEEALESGLNLTRGAAPITVVLSPGAGTVSGVVQNDKQQPVSGATVVLVPSGAGRERTRLFKNVTTDQYGRYSVKNIDPGDYKLFTWEDVESGAWFDPEFLKPVESRGSAITIRENSRENAQLDLIPSEAAAQSRKATDK